MYFRVCNVENADTAIKKAKFTAYRFVLLYRKAATEQQLDKYLLEKYHTPLITACINIIMHSKYSLNYQGDIIINPVSKKLDELASIITFGTGKLQGSKILRYAFGQF